MKKTLACVALLAASMTAGAQDQLYVYNWSEYMPEEVLSRFTKETGIKVVYSTYDSNEAMYAKLKLTGEGGYDIAVPSTYYVNKMRQENLLRKIDKSKLKNFKNLDPKLLNGSYDPGNEYSVPYLWGTTGIAVNAAEIDPANVTGWADLWKPEYKGQVLLTNDLREVFHLGLSTQGYSGNSTNEQEIKAAYEKLRSLIPNVRLFDSESPKQAYLSGEANIGIIWSGEAFMANQENSDIQYIYPKEGAIIWVDSLVIPANARNPEAAHRFIDFLLKPEIAKIITEEIGYSSPNIKAVELLDEEVRNNRIAYPTEEDLKNAEFQEDVGSAITLYEQYWERLKVNK